MIVVHLRGAGASLATVRPLELCRVSSVERGGNFTPFMNGVTIMKQILAAAMAGSLLLGGAGVALAQPRHDHGQHNGWNDGWRKGGRMDHDAWNRGARVDWHAHHLRAPPRGYEWREVDGRYVLAAITTGVIADIILNAR
jgi:hypothetical protein